MTKERSGAEELSVEEILESIRKVISNHKIKPNIYDTQEDILELVDEYKASDCDENNATEDEEQLLSDDVMEEASEILRDFTSKAQQFDHVLFHGKTGKTVEELVVEMIKPELKKWLNTNLPSIVRGLVEKEINRLSPHE